MNYLRDREIKLYKFAEIEGCGWHWNMNNLAPELLLLITEEYDFSNLDLMSRLCNAHLV